LNRGWRTDLTQLALFGVVLIAVQVINGFERTMVS
jgi:hypothetical protein